MNDDDEILPKEYYDALCQLGMENICAGKCVEGMGYILPEVIITPVKTGYNENFYKVEISHSILVNFKADTIPLPILESAFPQIYQHHKVAIEQRGKPVFLTVDRNTDNADKRRKLATYGIPTISGLDRDEYPYATTMEGGVGAYVKHVDFSQNRRHGAYVGGVIRSNNMRTGDVLRIILIPDNKKKELQPAPKPVPVPILLPEEKKDNVSMPVRVPATIPQPTAKDVGVFASILALLAILMKSADIVVSRTICPIFILPSTVDPYMSGQPNDNIY